MQSLFLDCLLLANFTGCGHLGRVDLGLLLGDTIINETELSLTITGESRFLLCKDLLNLMLYFEEARLLRRIDRLPETCVPGAHT